MSTINYKEIKSIGPINSGKVVNCQDEIKRLRNELKNARDRFRGVIFVCESNIQWINRALGEEI